jgi:glycogen synthase
MIHLLVCPEYPPAPIPPGGIGRYVRHIAHLMAERGETVHVVGTRWSGAPLAEESLIGGRLVIHRVPLDEPVDPAVPDSTAERDLQAMGTHDNRAQQFAFQCAPMIERLVRGEGIELIEAQEYDAPLYHYQLRRVLGVGPSETPPCMVQLHSPTELIFRHNEWSITRPDYLRTKRMEDFSIAAADALLCPSNFLARDAERHYGLPHGAIEVLRLPIGDTPVQPRDPATWDNQVVCYVGRLEPRKGVVEWIDAAVRIADEFPRARFEMLGADLPYAQGRSVKAHLLGRIPRRLIGRFYFRGSRTRAQVLKALGGSCAAVIPSRWENFPNTCIEAMCTGTPVIATRNGGMAEMLEDGRSGWLAASADVAGLAEALRRALSAPAEERARMGAEASRRIREICDNERTVAAHIELRTRIAGAGATRSHCLPVNLPWARRPLSDTGAVRRASAPVERIGVVFTCRTDGKALDDALASVRAQQLQPDASVVVVDDGHEPAVAEAVERAERGGWRVVRHPQTSQIGSAPLRNAGARLLIEDENVQAIVFLDEHDRLAPDLLEIAVRIMRHRDEAGIVSPWQQEARVSTARTPTPPAFPYQLLHDEIASCAMYRVEALRELEPDEKFLPDRYDRWSRTLRVMARDWAVVPIPHVLAWRGDAGADVVAAPSRPRLRDTLLRQVEPVVARDARELVLLLEAQGRQDGEPHTSLFNTLTPMRVLRLPLSEQFRIARKAASRPGDTTRWLLWHARRRMKRGDGGHT